MFPFETLNAKRHASLRLSPKRTFEFARHLNVIDVFENEIWRAASYFPVVFMRSTEGSAAQLKPVVVVSRSGQRNNLVGRSGTWLHPFLPSMLTIYPFSFAQYGTDVKILIDPLTPHLNDQNGVKLFNADGMPTESFDKVLAVIKVLIAQHQRTQKMCQVLDELDLLVPIKDSLDDTLSAKFRYYHVPIEKLEALKPSTVIVLRRQGWLPLLYAHAFSLQQDLNSNRPMVWAYTRSDIA